MLKALIALVLLSLVGVFWGGFVLAELWGWFMVPLGVHAITYLHAAGLATLLSVMLGSRGLQSSESGDEALITGFIYAFLIPFLGLVVGWVIHHNL